ncbi:Serine/threonine-protein kinase PknB [Aquisphaera giovannonii]|uniref:Serine/threonine-protein kinase PknB n=1 Tax=Aquisphaera giovannonii TaxID=406548 RepID=A0A5B9W5K1_9BACT|nr:serine/threonine-protein kinase [Aquisphaera giovannonii]QEH35474.1 Serine/threonine-protein kinase PknB [Aquisphaera giovannonii]
MDGPPDERELARLRDLVAASPACMTLPGHLAARLYGPGGGPGGRGDDDAPGRADGVPERVGPYRIVAERGRGGMGVVYEAVDEGLGRRVAVKVLAAGAFADAKARERFRREARAAAGLRHPHLVPVFAAEAPDAGPPYLVMPLVEGPTLAERIAGRRVLDPREAAELARQVADGLAAAHAAGTVHRDVKPANVIVDDADGAAKLADFGLARPRGHEGITSAGTIAGTPCYLSPEQVRTPDAADPRMDVYALGATLYECLAGVPPFRGGTLDVLRMIAENDPVPPRKLNRDVPRDLETIALKCLEKDPARRYASAAALRDDLARFLAGRPIEARPCGRLGAAAKWVRRNRTLAGLGATLAVALAAGSAASFVLWRRAEGQAVVARDREREAEAHLKAALDVVDRFCTRASEEQLLRQPGLQPLRKKLLGDAVAHYRGFVAARRGDASARAAVADALARLARLQVQLGEPAEAAATVREALALHGRLLEESPADPSRIAAVAGDRVVLGECLRHRREYEAAEAEALAAAGLFGRLGRGYRLPQASALAGAARAGMFLHPGTAIGGFREAAQVLEEILAEDPDAVDVKAELASTLHSLASNRMAAEDISTLERARSLWEELVAADPGWLNNRTGLAEAESNLGVLYKWGGRLPEAEEAYAGAIEALGRVVDENPRVLGWRRSLGQAHFNLATLLSQRAKHAESASQFEAARTHLAAFSRGDPGDVQARLEHAYAALGLAHEQLLLGRAEPAAGAWSEATPTVRDLIAAEGISGRQLAMLVELVQQHAALAHELGRSREGDELAEAMAAALARRKAADLLGPFFAWRAGLAGAHAPAELPGILDRWEAAAPGSPECLAWRGRVEAEAGRIDQARDLFRRAKAGGWKPPECWLAGPRLEGLLGAP